MRISNQCQLALGRWHLPQRFLRTGISRSTDHVTITNCYVTGGYEEGTLLDATYKRFAPDFKVPRNGRISSARRAMADPQYHGVQLRCRECRGIAIESVDGAIVEDIAITNITMRDLVDVPFFLRLGRRMRGPEGTPIGELRRVLISDIVVSNCASRQGPRLVTGIPGHYIEDVRFNNILIVHQGGGTKEDAAIQPPELEDVYPDPNRFGPLPAHGFYIRHAKRIEIKDVEVRPMKPDLRPGFALDDVNGQNSFTSNCHKLPTSRPSCSKTSETSASHKARLWQIRKWKTRN